MTPCCHVAIYVTHWFGHSLDKCRFALNHNPTPWSCTKYCTDNVKKFGQPLFILKLVAINSIGKSMSAKWIVNFHPWDASPKAFGLTLTKCGIVTCGFVVYYHRLAVLPLPHKLRITIQKNTTAWLNVLEYIHRYFTVPCIKQHLAF